MDTDGPLSIERRVDEVLAMYPPIARDGLLETLTNTDSAERARVIGQLYSAPQLRTLAELLIDLEGDAAIRASIVRMLRRYEKNR